MRLRADGAAGPFGNGLEDPADGIWNPLPMLPCALVLEESWRGSAAVVVVGVVVVYFKRHTGPVLARSGSDGGVVVVGGVDLIERRIRMSRIALVSDIRIGRGITALGGDSGVAVESFYVGHEGLILFIAIDNHPAEKSNLKGKPRGQT